MTLLDALFALGGLIVAIAAAALGIRRRAATAERHKTERDTDAHVIDRHDTREKVERRLRRDGPDAARDRLRSRFGRRDGG